MKNTQITQKCSVDLSRYWLKRARKWKVMNLFILDKDPCKAAQYNCDKHVVKIIIEAAQMLSTAQILHGISARYKLTHKNHPVSVWVRQSAQNYDWAFRHAKALRREYTNRYGRRHKTEDVIDYCGEHRPDLPDIGLTEFAQTMPEIYKNDDAVVAYRAFYLGDKIRFARWKNGNPEWWVQQ